MDIERDSGLVKNRLTAWAGWLGVASCAVMAVKCLPFVTALCRRELQGVTCNDSLVFIIDTRPIVLLWIVLAAGAFGCLVGSAYAGIRRFSRMGLAGCGISLFAILLPWIAGVNAWDGLSCSSGFSADILLVDELVGVIGEVLFVLASWEMVERLPDGGRKIGLAGVAAIAVYTSLGMNIGCVSKVSPSLASLVCSLVSWLESIGYLLLGWGFVLIARRGLGIADARMCIPFRVKVMVAFTISVVVFTLSRLPVNRQTPPDYVNTGDVRQNEVDACDADSGQP